MWTKEKLLLTLMYSFGILICVKCQTFVLDWKFGQIVGLTETATIEGNNYDIHKFLGIPFAQPPVDDLRFQRPVPVKYLDSPFIASNFSNACIQFVFYNESQQSEDCLYLNVYVPGKSADSTDGHAVAIWIHGGGFAGGAASQYDPTFISLFGNVIVVTINYRLGPYGFLSTGDENAPGNYALWDQHMAIQWVHDNIKDFGGDNQRVTLFGESAGGFSVTHQGLILQNNGLIQRVLAQSGSVVVTPSMKDPYEAAESFASLLGCDTSSSWSLMDCLRKTPNEQIQQVMTNNGISGDYFKYVIDKVLIHRDLTEIPSVMETEIIEEAEFYRSLDVMNGFNSHDGLIISLYFAGTFPEDLLMSRDAMRDMIDENLSIFHSKHYDKSVIEMVLAEYTNWTNPELLEAVREQHLKVYTDVFFGAPAAATSRLHAMAQIPAAKNYAYLFAANPPFGLLYSPEWVKGANHADELLFLFDREMFILNGASNTSWEMQLSRKMVQYWTNFMKSGDPNSPESVDPHWPMFDMDSQSYLKLEEETTENSVGHYLYAKEFNFWYKVLPPINMALDKASSNPDACVSASGPTVSSSVLQMVVLMLGVFSMVW